MDIKKILALAIVVLALFSCMSVASAGWFDFFGPSNSTYTFDGFTLDLPENANITDYTDNGDGYIKKDFDVEWADENSETGTTYITVSTVTGDSVVTTVDEYVSNWIAEGATSEGEYNGWAIININGVPMDFGDDFDFNITYSGYILAKHTGSKLIMIEGQDLTQLKAIVDTYKEV